ncbi:uncharacterized protein LOC141854439 [Brevipalpus obovatus]|uniref:uncharacterized protein LOC141854439 n=1 Tax=Brevipalpus obovatus TaxID=246614 RepID=UPI003D9F0737
MICDKFVKVSGILFLLIFPIIINLNEAKKSEKQKISKKSNDDVSLRLELNLATINATMKDIVTFMTDITRGILQPNVNSMNGRDYQFKWTSETALPGIDLIFGMTDEHASVLRALGIRRSSLAKSKVLKNARYQRRPVLQTMIELLEEQTAQRFSKEVGRFVIRHSADLAGLYFSGTAQILSALLQKFSYSLETPYEQKGIFWNPVYESELESQEDRISGNQKDVIHQQTESLAEAAEVSET